MKNRESNYIKGRLKSFTHAFNGMRILFKEERNVPIYIVLSIAALLMGYWLQVSTNEWMAISIVIGLVFAMEAANTAIEVLADYACNKEIHPAIKKTKDLAAAAVLITSISALVVGFIIFLPKLLTL